jgi:hypothetical protein
MEVNMARSQSRRSRYREDATHSLSNAQAAFEDWLDEHGYQPANTDVPFAVEAVVLVDEFLDDRPEFERSAKVIRRHAEAIGCVSDYDFDPDDHWD